MPMAAAPVHARTLPGAATAPGSSVGDNAHSEDPACPAGCGRLPAEAPASPPKPNSTFTVSYWARSSSATTFHSLCAQDLPSTGRLTSY